MKLTASTEEVVTNIVDFITNLVFKDEILADSKETQESASKAAIYKSAILKTDERSEAEREAIIRDYVELNPYYKELEDKYEIPPYVSRLAKDLDIIKQNESMVTKYSYLYHYRTLYKECLQSFYITSYSQALVSKPNYREFCLLTINLMAFLNLMHRWLETPFDIDIMSESQINTFMNSFGITFFRTLPLKYKQLIAKNLNRLITRKGTDKVIIDILEIFSFRDIDIYKYYLARQATDSVVGRDETTNFLENPNRDTYFIAHKIDIPSLSIALKNNDYKKFPFDRITANDPYWQAEKDEVKSLDFDYVQTKYFSIETGFELGNEAMNTMLMLNLLRRIREDYSNREFLNVTASYISDTRPAALEDIIITLQILTCNYQGVVDEIHYDLDSIVGVYNFANYDNPVINAELFADNPDLIGNVRNIEMRDLRNVGVFDSDSVKQVFNDNIKVKERMEALLKYETNYEKFKRLRNAYNGKFIQNLSYELFHPHTTYTSYIELHNQDLFGIITRISNIEDDDERRTATEEAISTLADIANGALDRFGLFFGSTSLNIVVGYMRRVILAFKSFTVSLNDLNVFVVIHERFQTKLLDGIRMETTGFNMRDDAPLNDKINGMTIRMNNKYHGGYPLYGFNNLNKSYTKLRDSIKITRIGNW